MEMHSWSCDLSVIHWVGSLQTAPGETQYTSLYPAPPSAYPMDSSTWAEPQQHAFRDFLAFQSYTPFKQSAGKRHTHTHILSSHHTVSRKAVSHESVWGKVKWRDWSERTKKCDQESLSGLWRSDFHSSNSQRHEAAEWQETSNKGSEQWCFKDKLWFKFMIIFYHFITFNHLVQPTH